LSLQGWYHSKDPPPQDELQKATLQQLKKLHHKNNDDNGNGNGNNNDNDDTNDGDNDNDAKMPPVSNNDVDQNTDVDPDAFTEEDRTYLQNYIQNEYLTETSMDEIQTKFESNSTIQFRNFLLQKWVPEIESNTYYNTDTNDSNANKSDNDKSDNDKSEHDNDQTNAIEKHYKQGVASGWQIRGPAHKQRYLSYTENGDSNDNDNNSDNQQHKEKTPSSSAAIGKLLHTVQKQVFESQPFLRYLKRVTSLDKPTGIIGNNGDQIRRFRPGLDYTVAHYGLLMQESVLDATMCFARDITEEDMAMWESGDIGGFECYIEADIDDDDLQQQENGESAVAKGKGPADEYNEEDDTELLSVSASNNTLSLVYRDPGTMRFVKYVSSSAPSSRYDICMEYELPPDNDEEDDENDDNDNDNDNDNDGA